MKTGEKLAVAVSILALLAWAAGAQQKANPGFEKMKTLVGEWQGTTGSGKSVKLTYRVTSGGSVVMETLSPADEETMVSMYHLDGDRLLMTHYCAAGNQPRMRAGKVSADSRQIEFTYQDATNLPSPDTSHMRGLVLTWADPDHLTHAWTWREKSKPDTTETFQFTRKQ